MDGEVQAVLLECKAWGLASGILGSSMTLRRGCCSGQEHQGRPAPPMRETLPSPLVLLLGRPVESRLGFEPVSVCMTFARHLPWRAVPGKSRPHALYKESVA